MKFLINWVLIGQSVVEAAGPREAEDQFKENREEIVKKGKDEVRLEIFVHKAE